MRPGDLAELEKVSLKMPAGGASRLVKLLRPGSGGRIKAELRMAGGLLRPKTIKSRVSRLRNEPYKNTIIPTRKELGY